MASQNRPGVEVVQELPATATVTATPTLVPVVAGICNQIIPLTNTDGSLNAEAKHAPEQYNQSSMLIPQAEFPNPRSNISELNIYESTIKLALLFGGKLYSLARGSNGTVGKAFLKVAPLSRNAVIRSTEKDSFAFGASPGVVLSLAFDVVNPLDSSRDVVVQLVGTLTAAEVVDAINTAVGAIVASVYVSSGNYVQIASTVYGATSSITLRAGTGALKILFGASFDDSKEYRVVGAGFRGQDDTDGDLTTPWIEAYRGGYFVDGVDTTFPVGPFTPSSNKLCALLGDLSGNYAAAKITQQFFAGVSATFPLVAATSSVPGDQFWANGAQVGGAEIIKIETERFKLGKLNVSLSTYDNSGVATTRVYDTVEVNTTNHPSAFAPKYAYFIADGLTYGNITPAGTAASLTGIGGATSILPARAAMVQGTAATTFPVNLASLTLDYALTVDGVEGAESTYTFTGGPFATAGDLVSAMSGEIAGVTVSKIGNRILFSTTKTGADQAISIKSTGTANPAFHFSTTASTDDAGKDVEYADQATLTGEHISTPLVGETAASLDLTIVDSKGTHVLSATGVDLAGPVTMATLVDAIAVAFGGTASSDPTIYDGAIPVATVSKTGTADGTLTITTVEGGATVTLSLTATDGTDGFRHLGFYDNAGDKWAESTSASALTFPVGALSGHVLTIAYNPGAATLTTGAFGASPVSDAATAVALAKDLNSISGLTKVAGTRVIWFIGDSTSNKITVRTVLGGATTSINVTSSAGTAGEDLVLTGGLKTGSASAGNCDDVGADGLNGTILKFSLDDNPFVFAPNFVSNSLAAAINDTNVLVNGATDVATDASSYFKLTSLLAGAASKVEVFTSTAATALGISGSASGTGRPNPDFYLDVNNSIVVGPSILRNQTTGQPFSLESAFATVYIAYNALRLDVTASALKPSLLALSSVDLIDAAIGPIDVDNPLALGAFLAKSNAPTVDVSVLGIDDQNAAAPLGTIDAWARALDLLGSKEVYALAPLTDAPFVNGLVSTHVQILSQATNRGERIAFIWQDNPTESLPQLLVSSGDAAANGTDNSLTVDVNPVPEIVTAGINVGGTIPVSDRLYIEVLVVDGGTSDLRRYSISEMNGVVLVLRTSFATGENEDGFYSTVTFDGASGLTGLDWSIRIRGEAMYVTGTTRFDSTAVSEAMAAEAAPYASRRVYFLTCSAVDTSVNGVVQKVPGYYVSAAIAGMVAAQKPQQPFTEVPIAGFTHVYGTDDTFSENQMDTIADGGRYVLVNRGGTVAPRHARSTSTTTIEERELSITKSIDWFAKMLRAQNRAFIGRNNITRGFLDQLTMLNQGAASLAENLGVFELADLKNILQDEKNPDTILIDIEVQPLYPCNKIRITIAA